MAYNSTSTDRSRCSNHGDFNSVSGCVCDTGWTGESLCTIIDVNVRSLICSVLNVDSSSFELNSGLSDLAIIDGVDCDISLTAIIVVSYIVICTTTLCTVMVVRYLIVRMIDRKTIFIVSRDPRSIFPIIFLLYMIDTLLYTGLKIQYQGRKIIGRDLFMTVVGCSLPTLALVGLVFYFFVVIKFLKSYIKIMPIGRRQRAANRFTMLVMACEIIPPLSAAAGMMPGVGLAYPQHLHIFARVYHIGIALNAWLYGILTASALGLVLFELKTHVESLHNAPDDLRVVLQRLTAAYHVISLNSFSVGLLSLLTGTSEYLLRRTTYFQLFDSLCCPIAITVLILTVSKIPHSLNEKDSSTSMRERLTSFTSKPLTFVRILTPRSVICPTDDPVNSIEPKLSLLSMRQESKLSSMVMSDIA